MELHDLHELHNSTELCIRVRREPTSWSVQEIDKLTLENYEEDNL